MNTIKSTLNNYSNLKRSSLPERFMFYDDGSWIDYSKEVADVLKVGFSDGVIEARVRGVSCVFDFYSMIETELETDHERSFAWVDVDGNSFFPKFIVNSCDENDCADDFVNCGNKCLNVDVDLKVNGNLVSSRCFKGLELSKTGNVGKEKMDDKCLNIDVDLKLNGNLVSSKCLKGVELSELSESSNVEKEKIEGSSSNVNVGCPKIKIELEIGGSVERPEGLESNKSLELNKRKRDERVEKGESSLNINVKSQQVVKLEPQSVESNKRKRDERVEKGESSLNINVKSQQVVKLEPQSVESNKRKRDESVEKGESSLNINAKSQQVVKLEPQSVESNKRKRDESVEKGESSLNINAKRQQVVKVESQPATWPKLRIMGANEGGFATVKNFLLSGFARVGLGVNVTAIHQCLRVGPMDKARFEVFQRQVEITKQARGENNMAFAWYGASAEGVKSILMNGFGVPSEASHSQGHGIGIHLSPINLPQNSPLLSDTNEHGEKHVILCRVILGKCEKVEAGSRQLYPSSVEYDTGVDDLANPNWYTVWHSNMHTHILPEYVVSYRPANVHGSIVVKLLSKLSRHLPISKVQEVQSLCISFKGGKLEKHVAMNQIRSVVGDDVLSSTIREIRAEN